MKDANLLPTYVDPAPSRQNVAYSQEEIEVNPSLLDYSIKGFSNMVAWVSGVFLIIGTLAKGSTIRFNEDPIFNQVARDFTVNLEVYEKAEKEYSSSSITFGWVLIAAALIWGIFSLVIHYLFKI